MVQTAKNETERQIELFEDTPGPAARGMATDFLILTAQSSSQGNGKLEIWSSIAVTGTASSQASELPAWFRQRPANSPAFRGPNGVAASCLSWSALFMGGNGQMQIGAKLFQQKFLLLVRFGWLGWLRFHSIKSGRLTLSPYILEI